MKPGFEQKMGISQWLKLQEFLNTEPVPKPEQIIHFVVRDLKISNPDQAKQVLQLARVYTRFRSKEASSGKTQIERQVAKESTQLLEKLKTLPPEEFTSLTDALEIRKPKDLRNPKKIVLLKEFLTSKIQFLADNSKLNPTQRSTYRDILSFTDTYQKHLFQVKQKKGLALFMGGLEDRLDEFTRQTNAFKKIFFKEEENAKGERNKSWFAFFGTGGGYAPLPSKERDPYLEILSRLPANVQPGQRLGEHRFELLVGSIGQPLVLNTSNGTLVHRDIDQQNAQHLSVPLKDIATAQIIGAILSALFPSDGSKGLGSDSKKLGIRDLNKFFKNYMGGLRAKDTLDERVVRQYQNLSIQLRVRGLSIYDLFGKLGALKKTTGTIDPKTARQSNIKKTLDTLLQQAQAQNSQALDALFG